MKLLDSIKQSTGYANLMTLLKMIGENTSYVISIPLLFISIFSCVTSIVIIVCCNFGGFFPLIINAIFVFFWSFLIYFRYKKNNPEQSKKDSE